MISSNKPERWLGLFFIVFALVLIFVWIPNDVETGAFQKVRRRLTIGDSLAPMVAGAVILLGGLITFLTPSDNAKSLDKNAVIWVGLVLLTAGVSISIMRWLGPGLTELLTEQSYRALRATAPWKYIGYVAGGGVLVYMLIGFATRSWKLQYLAIGLIAALCMALFYDLPFEDLQLPPNGDV
jgi:4-amino-4-deoxy-L-arabinose transferase-like glycosyltransferase